MKRTAPMSHKSVQIGAVLSYNYVLCYCQDQLKYTIKGRRIEKMNIAVDIDDTLTGITCQTPAKKYKLYKSSINKSLHFVQRSLSSSTRVQRVTAQLNLSRE